MCLFSTAPAPQTRCPCVAQVGLKLVLLPQLLKELKLLVDRSLKLL